MWYVPWAIPGRVQTPFLAEVRDLVEVTIIALYPGLWIVRQIPYLDCIIVNGPNLEYTAFTKQEVLENKTPKDFIKLIKRKIERW